MNDFPTKPMSEMPTDVVPSNATDLACKERYKITHRTHYSYSAPVTFNQLIVRLQPRSSYDQQVRSFHIEADPTPSRHTYCMDLHGNIRHWFWFEEQHDHLTLITSSIVDCFISNPFDFVVIDPGVETLHASYAEPVNTACLHYRTRSNPQPKVDALARKIMLESNQRTVPFLTNLAAHLRQSISQIVRHDGAPFSPTETLERGEGACRDSAVLFMDACRSVGLAARFVSGYAWEALNEDQRELHAWAEVYLPGAGWRGFDPTTGLAVTNRHIAIAASPTASYAAPTAGTFTGPKVETDLTYKITMENEKVGRVPPPQNITYSWP